MSHRTRQQSLTGMQRMMVRWEEFHALNAIHAVQLSGHWTADEVTIAIQQTVQRLGLTTAKFCHRGRSLQWCDHTASAERSQVSEHPPVQRLRSRVSGMAGLMDILNEQLNRRFPSTIHWPLRFVIVESPAGEMFLLLVYQHAVSDSRSISLVIREIVRRLAGRPPGIRQLRLKTPKMAELFPSDLGWRNLHRLALQTASHLRVGRQCFQPVSDFKAPTVVAAATPVPSCSVSTVKENARSLGVTVQDLFFAATLEAFHATYREQIDQGRRKSLAVYGPVDLRHEAPESLENAFAQVLGCLTVHLEINGNERFETIVSKVCRQTKASKSRRHYRTHSAQMGTMSRIWDLLPPSINRWLGPTLLPLTCLCSNVNLIQFLHDETAAGDIRSYFRFTGTGILVPWMVGLTTLGDRLNLTTTYHSNVLAEPKVYQMVDHIAQRLLGTTSCGQADVNRSENLRQLRIDEATSLNCPEPLPAAVAIHGFR